MNTNRNYLKSTENETFLYLVYCKHVTRLNERGSFICETKIFKVSMLLSYEVIE